MVDLAAVSVGKRPFTVESCLRALPPVEESPTQPSARDAREGSRVQIETVSHVRFGPPSKILQS